MHVWFRYKLAKLQIKLNKSNWNFPRKVWWLFFRDFFPVMNSNTFKFSSIKKAVKSEKILILALFQSIKSKRWQFSPSLLLLYLFVVEILNVWRKKNSLQISKFENFTFVNSRKESKNLNPFSWRSIKTTFPEAMMIWLLRTLPNESIKYWKMTESSWTAK